MKTTRVLKFIFSSGTFQFFAILLLGGHVQAFDSYENLEAWTSINGSYKIDSHESQICISAFSDLKLFVNPETQTVREIFSHGGFLNGLSTNGIVALVVNPYSQKEIVSRNSRRFERTLVEGQAIVMQESTVSPYFGFFAEWTTKSVLLQVLSSDQIVVYTKGHHCTFQRVIAQKHFLPLSFETVIYRKKGRRRLVS